jgi:signal transduction histidine kinase
MMDPSHEANPTSSKPKKTVYRKDAIDSSFPEFGEGSETTQLKQKLQVQPELVNIILDNIPAMVVFFNRNGKVGYLNRAFEVRTGWKMVSHERDLVNLCYPDEKVREQAVSFMLSGEQGWRTFPLHMADGNIMMSSWSNVRLEDGSYVGIGIDLTKEIQMERQIRNLAIQLSRTAEVEQQKIAGVLHDRIVQPMVSAKLHLEALKHDTSLPDSVVSSLEEVSEGLKDTLREARSISQDLFPPIVSQMRLNDMIHWLAGRLSDKFNIPITFDEQVQLESLESEQKNLIFLILRECIRNTSKHADAEHVHIILESDSETITMTIRDDGRGFDMRDLFNKAHDSSGFGLFHVKIRVEHYGGSLFVDSTPGKGTSVVIKIPL